MKYRVRTAAIAMPLVLGAVFCAKHLPIDCLAVACLLLALAELRRMAPTSKVGGVSAVCVGACAVGGGALSPIPQDWSAACAWLALGLCAVGSLAAVRLI